MDDHSLPFGWWGLPASPPRRLSVVELMAAGTLDAELAGLLWLLVEGRVPITVAAQARLAGKTTTLTALLDFLRTGLNVIGIDGRNFDPPLVEDAEPASSFVLAAEVSPHLPWYLWGEGAARVLRLASRGLGLGTTIHADSLEEALATLKKRPIGLTEDELSWLGVILVLRVVDIGLRTTGAVGGEAARPGQAAERTGPARRIVAAHYLRPVVQDAGGHRRRLGPAVLATWDPAADTFEHFAWGVLPDLAQRVNRRPGDFERDQRERADYLEGLLRHRIGDADRVRSALRAFPSPAPAPAGGAIA